MNWNQHIWYGVIKIFLIQWRFTIRLQSREFISFIELQMITLLKNVCWEIITLSSVINMLIRYITAPEDRQLTVPKTQAFWMQNTVRTVYAVGILHREFMSKLEWNIAIVALKKKIKQINSAVIVSIIVQICQKFTIADDQLRLMATCPKRQPTYCMPSIIQLTVYDRIEIHVYYNIRLWGL